MSKSQTRLLIPRDTLFYYLNKYWGGLSGRPSCSIMASICCLDLTYQMLDVAAAASLGWHSCFFRCSSDSPGWSSCATPSSRGTSTRNLSGEWPWKTKPNSWLDLEHTISWLSFKASHRSVPSKVMVSKFAPTSLRNSRWLLTPAPFASLSATQNWSALFSLLFVTAVLTHC